MSVGSPSYVFVVCTETNACRLSIKRFWKVFISLLLVLFTAGEEALTLKLR